MKLPDYVIYDRLRQEKEKEAERPRIHVPVYTPDYWDYVPENENEKEETDADRGVIIIQM